MIACRTAGVGETRALGAAVATIVDTGDVVVLVGDLGAGKTAFVQGFAASLGVTAPSPAPPSLWPTAMRGDWWSTTSMSIASTAPKR